MRVGRTSSGKWRSLVTVFSLVAALIIAVPGNNACAQTGTVPVILDDGRTAGYLTIGWPATGGSAFILQIDDGSGWRTAYEGPDRASTFSGLPDGAYRFRVRPMDTDDAWSPVLRVRVTHHSLARAYGFFGLGAAVFLILLLLLAAARRGDSSGEEEGAAT